MASIDEMGVSWQTGDILRAIAILSSLNRYHRRVQMRINLRLKSLQTAELMDRQSAVA